MPRDLSKPTQNHLNVHSVTQAEPVQKALYQQTCSNGYLQIFQGRKTLENTGRQRGEDVVCN